jgi:polysaccharide biosynthesis transport protein
MGKSNVLALSYEDADPAVAQKVCDAYTRAYIDYRQNTMTLTYPKGFFDREIAKVHADLEMWTERRRRFSATNDVVSVPDQTHMLFDLQNQLQKRRSDITTDLAQSEATVAAMQKLRDHPESDLPSLGASSEPGSIFGLRQKLLEQQARVALIRERYRDDSPEVVNAQETVQTLQDMLKSEVNSRVDLAQSHIQSLRAGLAVVDHDLATNRSQLAGMPAKEIALEQMDREIGVLKERYRSLTEDSDKARVTEKVTPTINVVLLRPAAPAVSKTTRDWIRIVLAPAFSLVVGIGLAFFLDGLDVTVRTSGQAEDAIELPVLAALNERRRSR